MVSDDFLFFLFLLFLLLYNSKDLFLSHEIWLFEIVIKYCDISLQDYAAAVAKSLQLCLTLCNPIDGSHQASPSLGFSRQDYTIALKNIST